MYRRLRLIYKHWEKYFDQLELNLASSASAQVSRNVPKLTSGSFYQFLWKVLGHWTLKQFNKWRVRPNTALFIICLTLISFLFIIIISTFTIIDSSVNKQSSTFLLNHRLKVFKTHYRNLFSYYLIFFLGSLLLHF